MGWSEEEFKTAATSALEHHADIAKVQEWLGHSTAWRQLTLHWMAIQCFQRIPLCSRSGCSRTV